MSQLTKQQLKSLIKECIIEIFAEGLGSKLTESVKRQTPIEQIQKKRPHPLDNVEYRSNKPVQQKKPVNRTFESSLTHAVSNLTNDSIMKSIFEDTARTTLQEQMQYEPRTNANSDHFFGGNSVTGGSGGIDIASMLGDSANNWSQIMERLD